MEVTNIFPTVDATRTFVFENLFVSVKLNCPQKSITSSEGDYISSIHQVWSTQSMAKRADLITLWHPPNFPVQRLPEGLCFFTMDKDVIHVLVVIFAKHTPVWIQTHLWKFPSNDFHSVYPLCNKVHKKNLHFFFGIGDLHRIVYILDAVV